MNEPHTTESAVATGCTPFHIARLDAASQVVTEFRGSCLDPNRPLTSQTPKEHLASNSKIFTSGGSLPRELWTDSALGVRIHGSVAETGARMELLDLCSMTCNTILGINDPWVKLKQASFLLSSHPHFLPVRIGCDLHYRIAHRVLRRFDQFGEPGDFVINMRQCNGSDAVELALHAAWKAAAESPARRKLAAFRGSYHGESMIASLISEHQPAHGSGRALVDQVDNVTLFPSPTCGDGGYLTAEALETLSVLERDGDSFFAVIIEPVQWRNAVHTVPLDFLRRLRDVCTRKSICLIFDEVQNAFGYTGTITFAENCGVCPDIMATGKALTSGHGALAIMVARKEYKEIEGPFGSKTNSGDMLAFVAVDAVMDRLLGLGPEEAKGLPTWLPSELIAELKTGLLSTAYPRIVKRLDDMLTDFQRLFPSLIGPSKGMGLNRGLIMLEANGEPSERLASKAAKVCLSHGVYVRQGGPAVLMKPSLAMREADFKSARARLHGTFAEVLRLRDEESD